MLNIIDVLIVLLIVVGAFLGFRRGIIKQGVITGGTFFVIFLSFMLKNPVSLFMYKNLPFFSFDLIIENSSVLNILVYETIAFLLCFSILEILLIIVIKLSSVAEMAVRATIILKAPSKFLGLILGMLESYLIVFILLFLLSQPFSPISESNLIEKSKLSPLILENTLFLTSITEDTMETVDEINELIEYKDDYTEKEFDCEVMKIMLKNKIINKSSAKYLYKHKKINTKCGIK